MRLVEGCRGQPRRGLGVQAITRSFQMLQLCLTVELRSHSLRLVHVPLHNTKIADDTGCPEEAIGLEAPVSSVTYLSISGDSDW